MVHGTQNQQITFKTSCAILDPEILRFAKTKLKLLFPDTQFVHRKITDYKHLMYNDLKMKAAK